MAARRRSRTAALALAIFAHVGVVLSYKRPPRNNVLLCAILLACASRCFGPAAMDQIELYVKPVRDFAKDSMRLVKRCTKPDLKGETLRLLR